MTKANETKANETKANETKTNETKKLVDAVSSKNVVIKNEEKVDEKKAEKTFTPPRGVDKKDYEKCLKIVKAEKKAKKSDDEIRMKLITEGNVMFVHVNKIFNQALIDLNIVTDPKEVKKLVLSEIKKAEIKFDMTREQLDEIAAKIVKKVNDSHLKTVLSAMRKMFKDNKKVFPQVERKNKGRMGVVNKTIIDVFAKNKKASEVDLIAALKKVSDNKMTEENAKSWYKICWALINGKNSEETLKHFSSAK